MHRLPRFSRLRQQSQILSRLNGLSQRRLQAQYAYKPKAENLRYQTVRLRGPGLTLRRTAAIGFYIGAVYVYVGLILRYLNIEISFTDNREVMEEEDEVQEEEKEEGKEELDDGWFIPMTWATEMPRTYYTGSDPEWQEFLKFAGDPARHRKIKDELLQILLVESKSNPDICRMLGKDTRIGKFWLDMLFPQGPPQDYKRGGIEIGDSYIAWSQDTISAESRWRLMRALWPKAAFDSVWATSKVLAGINYRRIKQALGWEDKDALSPEKRYRLAINMQKQQQARQQSEISKAQIDPAGNPSEVVGLSGNTETPSRSTTNETGRLPWQIQLPLPSPLSPKNLADIPIAMHVFRSTLSERWNRTEMEPPRGSFIVQGIVEVAGSKGLMWYDVQSCYDPKLNKYVFISVDVRSFKRWRQPPRAGP